MPDHRRSIILSLSILFAAALLARVLLLIVRPFDGLYGQDAFAYYDYAIALKAALAQSQLPPAFFWPIGFPLQLVLSFALFGVRPIAAQLISLIAGASIAPLAYLVARESLIDLDQARAQRAGLVAGSIVLVAGQLMISSLSIMSDVSALMWATLSAWLLLRYVRRLRSLDLALSVLALSLSVLCRWAYALLIVPWTLIVLLVWRERWPFIRLKRAAVLTLLALFMSGSLIGGSVLLGGSHTGDLQVVAWSPANAVQSIVTNSDGTFVYALPIGLYYAQPLIHPAFLFPVLIPFWLIGLRSILRRRRSATAVLIGWPLMVYLFLAGIAWQNPRFSLELFPALAVWVGVGFDQLWFDRINWRRGLVGLLAIGLIGSTFWSIRVVGDFVALKNTDLNRVQHVAALLPADARVITFSLTAMLAHYTAFQTIEIYNETPQALAHEVCGQANTFAYLDVTNLNQQWTGLAPEINYRWLIDHAGLQPIDQYQGYTLFKVSEQCR